ncbi:MAG: ribose 5-phosphate isomerase B [Candidatus Omnitrophica bacterium]|nr:ribose 5-phosphate isomerase B [Candidatus Omnitrophota bacterium]
MKIVIGADHGGFKLKEELLRFLKKKGIEVSDFGTYSEESCDYPEISYRVARAVSKKQYNRGILICKSGIGNSIVANKVRGVRAALAYNLKAAEFSRRHNDANVLVLGASFVTGDTAKKIVDAWLNTEFEGGRHSRRVRQISAIEKKIDRRVE